MAERPTVAIQCVDIGSSEIGALPETALFAGYQATPLERRPCVCGGTVTADPLAPARGVAAHQFTSRHRGWRLTREQEA